MERKALEQLVRDVLSRMEAGKAEGIQAERGKPEDSKPVIEKTAAACCRDLIPVEVSARHVHLSLEDLRTLFGAEFLPQKKDISQPGQYLSEYRVCLIGPKGMLENVAVLGPVRGATQAEISATDARNLGIRAPVRLSGDLDGAAMLCLQAGERIVQKPCGIIAKRHVHMTPQEAAAFGLKNGEELALSVEGERSLTLEGVAVRVSAEAALALHIDTDEANAAGVWDKTDSCRIVDRRSANGIRQAGAAHEKAESKPDKHEAALEGKLLCERDVIALAKAGVQTLHVKKGQLITPLALDALRGREITLVREEQQG